MEILERFRWIDIKFRELDGVIRVIWRSSGLDDAISCFLFYSLLWWLL